MIPVFVKPLIDSKPIPGLTSQNEVAGVSLTEGWLECTHYQEGCSRSRGPLGSSDVQGRAVQNPLTFECRMGPHYVHLMKALTTAAKIDLEVLFFRQLGPDSANPGASECDGKRQCNDGNCIDLHVIAPNMLDPSTASVPLRMMCTIVFNTWCWEACGERGKAMHTETWTKQA